VPRKNGVWDREFESGFGKEVKKALENKSKMMCSAGIDFKTV